jgi:hypothetical protein
MVGCRVPATPTLATVLNLSASGCLLESDQPCISHGSTILIQLPGACEIAGQVMWCRGSRVGVKFNSGLEAGVVAAILGGDHAMHEAGNLKDKFGRDLPPLPRLAKAIIHTVETGPEQSAE